MNSIFNNNVYHAINKEINLTFGLNRVSTFNSTMMNFRQFIFLGDITTFLDYISS